MVSGKDPTRSPGGYAAYSHNLCKILVRLDCNVFIIAAGEKHEIQKTPLGELHLVPNKLASLMSVLGSVEMAFMPLFVFSFMKEILDITKSNRISTYSIWGMGPWSFTGALLKMRQLHNVRLYTSAFTTFRHEMAGSLASIMTPDYPLLTKIKYIAVSHVAGLLFSLIERYTYGRTDTIVTHYRSTEEILKKEFGIEKSKMKRISYYVDVFERSPSPTYEAEVRRRTFDSPVILSVCRQDARKGINFLLHAIKHINDQGVHCSLVIVGSGSLLELNKRLADRLGLSNAYFLGYQAKIDDLYKRADAFVLSSTEEGSGSLSLLEAMREGLPIVASAVDGIGEDVTHNKSAILVKSASSIDLARAILLLLQNTKKARILGSSAKRTYQKRFNFDIMKRDVSQLL